MKNRYDDIIEYNWTGLKDRPQMPLAERAKIFAPFAALKGFEEELDNIATIKLLDNSGN